MLQSEPVSKYILMANTNRTKIRPRKKSKKDIAVPLAAAGATRSLAIQLLSALTIITYRSGRER